MTILIESPSFSFGWGTSRYLMYYDEDIISPFIFLISVAGCYMFYEVIKIGKNYYNKLSGRQG